MPVITRTTVDEREIAAAAARTKTELRPDVVRIRFNVGRDWTDVPSLFFRVVLSDKAADPDRLMKIGTRIEESLLRKVRAHELDLNVYFNFRSKSESDEFADPEWM